MSAQVISLDLDDHPNRLVVSQLRNSMNRIETNEHRTEVLRALVRIQALEGRAAAVAFLENTLLCIKGKGVCGNE